MYFVITNFDGDTRVDTYSSKEELLRDGYIDEYLKHDGIFEAGDKINNDTAMWGGEALIIKGEVVCPTPVKVIEEYDIV